MQPYGDEWRNQRKAITQSFTSSNVSMYFPIQERQAAVLVQNILKNPHKLFDEVNFQIATIIVRVTYGHYLTDESDRIYSLAMECMETFGIASVPGNFMVDFFPARYHWTKEHLVTGDAYLPSVVGSVLQESGGNLSPDVEHNLVWGTSAAFGGGMDTNMSTILNFFHAMILHPEVQRKAQAEIDALTGSQRLPTINDRSSLPYIRALVTELYRWHPAGPLGG
ncbi:hypothetical protein Clacol_008621 [Clathrus columnatus]|uniref:Cytochrome P450 n=1 Tax=Clathrus columnatus TaxID=1419009 RepID=A0AAV5AI86_9AGAM|nr:hypothetical protein Clacol_008621 [Clathrus columnatus]